MRLLDGIQSALNPYGPHAAVIAEISWVLFVGAAVIFAAVMALLGWALWRRPAWLGSHGMIIAGGIVFPVVVLSTLLVYTLARAGALRTLEAPAVRIAVVGHQWWWHVVYLDEKGDVDFVTANEVHLPVGGSVEVQVRTTDVLHSFWVPTLAGKLDMIPGQDNRLRLLAREAGVVRGQCAEYCGGPHAQMAFFVVAEPQAAFDEWREAQRRPARAPQADFLLAGQRLFLSQCAACHTVRGTPASGELGPDLTHVGSRLSIGAGILPNNVGAIAGWIASSQHLKPGNLMPAFGHFSGAELRALAAYVASLR